MGWMRWNVAEFTREADRMAARYQSEIRWFEWRDPQFIQNAWTLYVAANQNSLGMLLLGDATIRTSRELLMNFGLASGSGVSSEQELKQIAEIRKTRQELAGPGSGAAVSALGPGSILNDSNWSPLLNDSYILGGVHAGQDFHWAEPGFAQYSMLGEREFLDRRDALIAPAQRQAEALKRDAAYYKKRWQHYLLGHANFWDRGNVRVFARELIGLKTFGYAPVFTSASLSFTCTNYPGRTATFERYLNGLAAVNFNANDRDAINAALGEFLFGDANALAQLSNRAAPPPPGQHLLRPSPTKPAGWKH